MLKNENIICISSIDWDFIWQGHQEIMSTFARNGNRVLFIENTGVRVPTLRDFPRIKSRLLNWARGISGIRKEQDNLYVFSPLVAPLPYSRIVRLINKWLLLFTLKRWIKVMDFHDAVIWTFLPTGLTLDLINSLDKKAVVYYCIDNFAVSSALAQKVKITEKRLIRQADLVFVTAQELYNFCAQYSKRVHLFPFGVNIENFERVQLQQARLPDDLAKIPRPIVGYIGGIHKWIDQDLIKTAAQSRPDYSFVFVGPLQTEVSKLTTLKNIYFLGHKAHTELPEYVSHFDVGIIPYLLTEYTKNVYPTKLNEYLALGKPVVSTDLLEIKAFNKRYNNVVAVGKDPAEFTRRLTEILEAPQSEEIRRRRIQIARENTWKNRIDQMCALISEAIEHRKHDTQLMWKEDFLRFYRVARRRLLKVTASVLCSYLLVFHTPFVWSVAKPLKITQAPRPCDVIVVFAGGVGESGLAGQGYEERVLHAVQLHKEGWAGNLIFSSGYGYAVEETRVMEALAVSLGVLPEKIICEKKAANTYENVAFTAEIMRQYGWKSLLVVSSPYNMLRVKLVYSKVAPGLQVVYSPVPHSLFYGDTTTVSSKQIKAIAHEYLGILYYLWKGHI
ncbi:MAG: ElyC/SanA/YdcF family protein [Candidatus Omnitrophota bacterium]